MPSNFVSAEWRDQKLHSSAHALIFCLLLSHPPPFHLPGLWNVSLVDAAKSDLTWSEAINRKALHPPT